MKQDQLNDILRQSRERMLKLTVEKGHEYIAGNADRLHNFKHIAEELGLSPMQVWYIYFKKHSDAVLSFIKDGKEKSSEPVEGRIDDMQVYLDLLRGLVWEHKNKEIDLTKIKVDNSRNGGKIVLEEEKYRHTEAAVVVGDDGKYKFEHSVK